MTQPRLLGGRYELDGVVGRGGMAEVYRARDIRLDRIVAIKTLRADLARDQVFQVRFRREAQSAASLNHPNIVAVYDTGEDMATGVPVPYIVMEFVDGRTVRDLLTEGHRLLPERSLEIIEGVLRALDYSHQAGIVHRDIKPGNIMVTRNGDVKVMDFGIARAMSDAQSTMTQTAQVIGTAQYLSPEQARGERVDSRSDIYSTGCVLYELLTGRPPFTGDSPVAIAYQHVRENPVPPSVADPDVPPWADAVVLRAMAKSPADRYQTAGEMRADLQRAGAGMPVAAAAPTRLDYPRTQRLGGPAMAAGPTSQIPPVEDYEYPEGGYDGERRSHRWIPWVLGLLLVIAVVGGVAYYLLGSTGKTAAVPLVNNEPLATAQQQISQAHLRSTVVDRSNSSVRKGYVIDSNPPAGNNVPVNTLVTLYVSTGPAAVSVPNVVGQQQTQAQSALQSAGFNVKVDTDPTASQPAGQVISQNPSGGGTATPGSTVTITVSGGAVTVPSVIGDSQQTATSILTTAGFQVNAQQGTTTQGNFANGTVFNQVPAANGTAAKGSTVTIYVQNGATQSPSPPASPSSSGSPSPNPTVTISFLPPQSRPGGPGRPPRGAATLGFRTASRPEEAVVPKSRVRKKTVYTPPPRKTARRKASPPWVGPTIAACLVIGLAWIAVYYITQGSAAGMSALGGWNLVVGFAFIIGGVTLSTRWR
jgi:serine/threonine protein kinase